MDLEQIRNCIGADAPDAVDRFWQPLLEMADLLAENAELGNKTINADQKHADIRWIIAPGFRNYLIFYRPYLDSVLIVRILHAAQDSTPFPREG